MAMEDTLCVDDPSDHDVMCTMEECQCILIALVRADERRRFRSEIVGVIERYSR